MVAIAGMVSAPRGVYAQQIPSSDQLQLPVGQDNSAPRPDFSVPDNSPAPQDLGTPDNSPAPQDLGTPDNSSGDDQTRILVTEVSVEGVKGDLAQKVYQVIQTRPGQVTTQAQLQNDVNAIFAIGLFSQVRVSAADTPFGVKVTFQVQANPVLKQVQATGTKVLPPQELQRIFSPEYGQILNLGHLKEGIQQLNQWYQDHGYVLAQVVGAPQVSDDGTVTLNIAEGVVESIQVNFLGKDGQAVDSKGRPVKAYTKPYIVLRELELKPGEVFNRDTVQQDLKRLYDLGIFTDVKVNLKPGADPRKVVVILNVSQKRNGNIGVGAGISSASGLFGTASYNQDNFRGRDQKLGAEVEVGQRDLLFDLSYSDPWIKNNPHHLGYTIDVFKHQSISLVFNGNNANIHLPNGDDPVIDRTGAEVTFTRPLGKDPLHPSPWTASLGFLYQHVAILDSHGYVTATSDNGELLSFSRSGVDDLTTIQFGLVRDTRNNRINPSRGTVFTVATEQSIPIGSGSILFNRVRSSYSYYIPVRFLPLRNKGVQVLAFNVQGGAVVGDLPPYEAFVLGGSNSVRGYGEGEVGSGRYFVQGTVEYRFPIFRIVGGAVFVDAASALGSQGLVPGQPGNVRGLPGSGAAAGLGVRINSPVGPIRIDYGFNIQGGSQFNFGIGQRF